MSKIIFESGLELNCELVELERRYSHGAKIMIMIMCIQIMRSFMSLNITGQNIF